MNAFDTALEFTLKIETGGDPNGGYNDRPTDRGGPTKWGISQRAYPQLNIKDLTRSDAREIYFLDYWEVARCDQFDDAVAIAHFDCAVNSGPGNAAKILQRAVDADDDGVIGAATVARVTILNRERGAVALAALLIEERARFLVNNSDEPEKPRELANLKNLEGWVVRLVRLTSYVSRFH